MKISILRIRGRKKEETVPQVRPLNRQEELQMKFHMTPRLHRDLAAGMHNN